jgi:hypothetical protein
LLSLTGAGQGRLSTVTRLSDTTRCPSCRAPLPGQPELCPQCGLRLIGGLSGHLWQTLHYADQLIAQIRASEPASTAPAHPPQPYRPQPYQPQLPPHALPASRSARSLSVPAILLGLGSTCLIVAAVVFTAVTWTTLGIGVRALILIALTVLLGAGSAFAAKASLRTTAEALSVAASGMLTVNLCAARGYGLLGLGSIDGGWFAVILGGVVGGVGIASALMVRRIPKGELTGQQIIAAVSLLVIEAGLAIVWDYKPAVFAALAVISLAAIAVLAHRGRLFPVAVSAAVLSGLSWIGLTALGLWDATTHRSAAQLWGHGQVTGLLSAAALAATVVTIRRSGPELAVVAATCTAGIALFVAWLPLTRYTPTVAAVSLACGVVVLATVGWLVSLAVLPPPTVAAPQAPTVSWLYGIRVAASLACLPLALIVLTAVLAALDLTGEALHPWQYSPFAHLPHDVVAGDLPAWLGIVAVLAIGAVLLLNWPRHRLTRPAVVAGAGSGLTAVGILSLPLGLAVALGVALVVAVHAFGRARSDTSMLAISVGLAGVFGVLAMHARSVHVLTWLAVAGLSAAAIMTARQRWVAYSGCVLGTVGALGACYPAAVLLGRDAPMSRSVPIGALASAVGAIAAMAGAQYLARTKRRPCREWIEGSAAVVAIGSVLGALDRPGVLTVVLVLLGTAAIVAGSLSPDRRWLIWVGQGFELLATWQRLVDSDVRVVEAYTLPAAAVMLAAGFWRLHEHPDTTTLAALSSGLSAATLPSLLLTLDEPTSLRGTLMACACVLLLGWGIALRHSGPMVVGAAETAVLLLAHLTPVAHIVPRWVTIAVVGIALLTVGVTWEWQLGKARTALRYVRQLA